MNILVFRFYECIRDILVDILIQHIDKLKIDQNL